MKHRIIECKEQSRDWDKFVCAIGLPNLMNATESTLRNDISNTVPATAFELFKSNPDKDIKLYHSIIPYGAGGSFLGAIQEVAKGSLSVEVLNPQNRIGNLWDGTHGLNFKETATFDDMGSNRTADIEDTVLNLMTGETTWHDLWGKLIIQMGKFSTEHEIQTHIDILTLPFFVNVERTFFLDMDFETFVWTHFLANMKHAVNGIPGAKNVSRYVKEDHRSLNPISQHLERCNNEWKIHCIAKNYGLIPKLKLTYEELIVEQQADSIKKYLEATADADTSDQTILTCQELLKSYHNENLIIMENWDNVKNKILNSYKWDRTYE